ncbi:hypothetical protein DPEC_G00233370 [Dallia pectoralis]|uniref:Uncharacterized protein n=1 Tax=Dallia pectoralis TaxID=75939 RepID=A0ACC2FXN9_DALPE|nr:hypothetical protein DPEC_G00233370 [Dallia pectoralis]
MIRNGPFLDSLHGPVPHYLASHANGLDGQTASERRRWPLGISRTERLPTDRRPRNASASPELGNPKDRFLLAACCTGLYRGFVKRPVFTGSQECQRRLGERPNLAPVMATVSVCS